MENNSKVNRLFNKKEVPLKSSEGSPKGLSYVHIKRQLFDQGIMVPDTTDLSSIIKDDHISDWYKSVYQFPEEAKEYFDKNNHSIANYSGTAFSDKLLFDIDYKNDFSVSQKSTIEILKRLKEDGVDVTNCVNLYFSGNKGFHVEVRFENEKLTPEESLKITSFLYEKN